MLLRSVRTIHAYDFQDVWQLKSTRPTTSRKAGYAPGIVTIQCHHRLTAPRLSVNNQRRLWGTLRLSSFVNENVLRADTIASADRFVCPLRMTDQEINWTLLAPCYLSNSIT